LSRRDDNCSGNHGHRDAIRVLSACSPH
jgi:hypothetical protein